MNENYTVGWNTFANHLKETNKKLYDKKYFADVTLVSGDMVQIQAHRFILSNASPILEKLLSMNQDTKALIYLKGIKHEEMKAITKFIYLGETKVQPDRVDDFLKASADLEIKYFHNKSSNQHDTENKVEKQANVTEQLSKSPPIKEELDHDQKTIKQGEEQIFECTYTFCNKLFSRKDLLQKHEAKSHIKEGNFICTSYADCNKKYARKDALEKHVQIAHLVKEGNLVCSYSSCQKTFPKRDQLELHEYKVHKDFKCSECNIYFKGKNAHYKHMKTLHFRNYRVKGEQLNLNQVCQICLKPFSGKDELEKHVDVAHKETCKICQLRVLKKNMNRHKLTHEDQDSDKDPNEDEDYILEDDF